MSDKEKLGTSVPDGTYIGESGDKLALYGADPAYRGFTGTYDGLTGAAGSTVISPASYAAGVTGAVDLANCLYKTAVNVGLIRGLTSNQILSN